MSYFSGLKPDLRKSEIAGMRVLRGFQVAVCGMRCIDLNNGTLKLLGILKIERRKKTLKTLADVQLVLKI